LQILSHIAELELNVEIINVYNKCQQPLTGDVNEMSGFSWSERRELLTPGARERRLTSDRCTGYSRGRD